MAAVTSRIMKLTLKHLHHQPSSSLKLLIERHLEKLSESIQIEEARVVVENRAEASPPFHMSFHLVTPGPDIFVEARDHTLRAALQKVVDDLESEVARRQLKRTQRIRTGTKKTVAGNASVVGVRK